MPFSDLYQRVQGQKPKIKTGWLRDQVIAMTHITTVREQWTGSLEGLAVRGFYVEGPLGPPVPLGPNEALIVLSRSLDKAWRRFIYTKELMHAFDTDAEKTDTPEKFDAQIERFGDPAAELTPQYRSEVIAFWRAVAVLCPEGLRQAMADAARNGEISIDVAAARLALPPRIVEDMFREDFPKLVEQIKVDRE